MSRRRRFDWRVLPIIAAGLVLAGLSYVYKDYAFVRTPKLPQPTLQQLAARHNVRLGMLTYANRLDDSPYTAILGSQYGMVTADGPVHWDTAHTAANTYDFHDMDKIVTFAQAHGMTAQGHHLLWDEGDSIPAWVKEGGYSTAQLRQLVRDHITTVAGRYAGRVSEWSVVNEPFTRAQHKYGLDSWWRDHLGGTDAYMDDAFRWARQADPRAKLILNDFDNQTINEVSDAQYAYTKAALARGVPIDGTGLQMHIDASRPPSKAAMIANMKRFSALGVPVYITEFDVNSSNVQGDASYKAALEARITYDVVRACIESQSCVSFTVFGMTDRAGFDKWFHRAGKRSYLMTARYQPKPSFYAFRDAWAQP